MSEDGHRYSFGAPRGGWPSFGPDGKKIEETDDMDEPILPGARYVGNMGGIKVYEHDDCPPNTAYMLRPGDVFHEPITNGDEYEATFVDSTFTVSDSDASGRYRFDLRKSDSGYDSEGDYHHPEVREQ